MRGSTPVRFIPVTPRAVSLIPAAVAGSYRAERLPPDLLL